MLQRCSAWDPMGRQCSVWRYNQGLSAFTLLRRELEAIDMVVNTAKTVSPPPKGHASTAEEIRSLKVLIFA